MSQRRRLPLALTVAGLLCAIAISGLALGFPAIAPAGTAPPATLPACNAGNQLAMSAGYDDWRDTLLDPTYALPDGYRPPDLERQVVAGKPVWLRAFVIGPLRSMLSAAAADGVVISVTSSYRSYDDQIDLEHQLGEVDDLVARAGHSEHQLGTAVDLNGGWDWLRKHAPMFGFALSYPPGRDTTLTCYRAEPWHWRYFGVGRAMAITDSGLSPREWLWLEAASR
jgi:D-alanyl-D-alanine carboxypeptidase